MYVLIARSVKPAWASRPSAYPADAEIRFHLQIQSSKPSDPFIGLRNLNVHFIDITSVSL